MKSVSICRYALIGVCALFLFGCSSTKPVRPIDPARDQEVLKKIAVIHFQRLQAYDGSRTARCPIAGTLYSTCDFPQNAELLVQDYFLEKLEKSGKFHVIQPYQSDVVFQKIRDENPKMPILEQLSRTGQALDTDGVAIGYVSCLRERVGYAYSAERPASVTLGLYLVRVRDAELVWGGVFDKTQQSFSENVFQASTFFSRGLKWVTAAELAQDGVDEMIKTFPGYK